MHNDPGGFLHINIMADIPCGSSKSKMKRRFASASSTSDMEKLIPGQLLLPLPNGNISKFCPLKSISLFKIFQARIVQSLTSILDRLLLLFH